ncbi:MAG: hypothetical protein FWC62_08715, partial [Firmicutes bacterium]|nr:hypothetical protein [Bacillota bacterium]
MPSPWNRSPEELHSLYVENTEAFYRLAGRALAPAVDDFLRACALGLWAKAGGLTQTHADAYNALYSKGRSAPARLLWDLASDVCNQAGGAAGAPSGESGAPGASRPAADFLPPL